MDSPAERHQRYLRVIAGRYPWHTVKSDIRRKLEDARVELAKLDYHWALPKRAQSGVPYLTKEYHGISYSVCYFPRTRVYRLFRPDNRPGKSHGTQIKVTCPTVQSIVAYMRHDGNLPLLVGEMGKDNV